LIKPQCFALVCGFANYCRSTYWCGLFSRQEKHKSVAFDVKQTRFLPNSVSADSTKFLGILSVDCIPNRRYFINATNWLFSKKEMNTKLIQTNYGIIIT
jgi:hypothetical protein